MIGAIASPNAYAQVKWSKYSYFQNSGGLNDISSSTEINDGEATDLQNVIFDTGGAIKKRFGYDNIPAGPIKVVSTGSAITGLSFFKQNNGDRFLFATVNVSSGIQAYKKNYNSGSGPVSGPWDNVSSGLSGSGYDNNGLVSFTVANNNLVFAYPDSTPVKPFLWSGSGNTATLTADSDCPTASLVVYHKNILFLSGNTTNPSRLYFSSLTDITDFTATDFIDVNTSDGSKIRGLISAFDSLYIFKDNSIWRLSGSDRDSFVLEKMVDNIGTLSHQSLAIAGGVIYFVTGQNDIAAYDGNYTVQFISQKIRNTIGNLNFSRAQYALGLPFSTYKYVDNDYYVSVSTQGETTNNQVLFFDTAWKAWSKFSGMNVNAWAVADDDSGQKMMVFGDYSGYVYHYPSTSYHDGEIASSPIAAYYQTKWFRYPEISLGDKYWRRIKTYVQAEQSGGTLYLEAKSDFESTGRLFSIDLSQGGSLWDTAMWDVDVWGGTLLTIKTNEVEKGTNLFQIKYINENVDEGFSILGFENFLEGADRI